MQGLRGIISGFNTVFPDGFYVTRANANGNFDITKDICHIKRQLKELEKEIVSLPELVPFCHFSISQRICDKILGPEVK